MAQKPYWFPTKKYGWGWGFPLTWQGWVVFIGYFVLLLAGIPFFDPRANPEGYVAYALALSGLLVAICWLKGEPPKWRWG